MMAVRPGRGGCDDGMLDFDIKTNARELLAELLISKLNANLICFADSAGGSMGTVGSNSL